MPSAPIPIGNLLMLAISSPDFAPPNDALEELGKGGALQAAEKLLKRCHSEEQRRRISRGLESTQSEIPRCAQDDRVAAFLRSL